MRQKISRSLVSLTVVIVVLVLFSPCGFAEDPSPQALSLSDAIRSAMSKRAELQVAVVEASCPAAPLGGIDSQQAFYQSENLRPGTDFTQNRYVRLATEAIEVLEDGERALPRPTAPLTGLNSHSSNRRGPRTSRSSTYWDALRSVSATSGGAECGVLSRDSRLQREALQRENCRSRLLRVRLEEARAEANTESNRLAEAGAKQKLAREMGLKQQGTGA